MNTVHCVLPDVAQPRNACVRGLRHRPLHVEMEHVFGGTCSRFGHPPPVWIAGTGCTVAAVSVPDKIHPIADQSFIDLQ